MQSSSTLFTHPKQATNESKNPELASETVTKRSLSGEFIKQYCDPLNKNMDAQYEKQKIVILKLIEELTKAIKGNFKSTFKEKFTELEDVIIDFRLNILGLRETDYFFQGLKKDKEDQIDGIFRGYDHQLSRAETYYIDKFITDLNKITTRLEDKIASLKSDTAVAALRKYKSIEAEFAPKEAPKEPAAVAKNSCVIL